MKSVKIKSIRKLGIEQTFDIEMPDVHNYVVNNVVSHNSHSAAYALIGYWCEWIKLKYPLEFWTSSLNFVKYEEQISSRLCEMKKLRQGISVKTPSINNSGFEFDCDNEKTIYWSLIKIKGLGSSAVSKILNERELNGAFTGYDDFVKRMPKKHINKKTIITLILAGAFDEVEEISKPLERINLIKRHFERISEPLPGEYKSEAIYKSYFWILIQRDLTGFGEIDYRVLMLSLNKSILRKMAETYIDAEKFVSWRRNRVAVTVCGVVVFNTIKKSKNGKEYASINIISNNEELSILLWEDVLNEGENRKFTEECMGKVVAISGKMNYDEMRKNNVLYGFEGTKLQYLDTNVYISKNESNESSSEH